MGPRFPKARGRTGTNMSVSNAILVRLETSDQGTFGRLYIDDNEAFYTMELPWRDNKSNLSCIPKGKYKCSWVYSDHFKKSVYCLEKTAPRWGICIHAATYAGDVTKGLRNHLAGCIALGEKVGIMDGQKCLLISRPAIRRFEQITQGKAFELEIR